MIQPETALNNYSNGFTPTIPQEKALLSVSKMKQQDKNKYLVVLPSGIGKTYLSAFETYDFAGNILYVVHRNEILTQAKEVFKKIHNIKDEDIGLYNGKNKQSDKKITFATIQTISRKKNLEKFAKDFFDYIILDEWHHVGALTYKRFLKYFKPKYLLGMTATPYRLDGKDILQHVNYNIPYQMELKEGIDSGFLVPFIYYGLWDDVDYSDIKWDGYRYSKKDLDKKLLINRRDDAVIKEVKEKIGDRQSIAFCCSVKHVKRCVRKFNNAGFSTIGIHWEIDLEKRKNIIKNFRKGKHQIIFTVDLFNEGLDFPGVEGLLFLRPTFSKTVFFQQLGRGLRKKEGKENVIVLDFIGNYVNAYKIQEWLKEVVPTGEKGSYFKPEHVYGVPEVHFDDAVIDLFKLRTPRSDEEVIEEFYKLKKELGRMPYVSDLNSKLEYEIYSRWGNWRNFLRHLTIIPYFGSKTLDEIKKEINKAINLLGKVPTTDECQDLNKKRILKFNIHSACYAQGTTYGKILYEMGEKPNNWRFIDLDILIEVYNKIKKDKGKIPLGSDFPFGLYIFQKLGFKTYQDFLKYMGDDPRVHRGTNKKEFIDDVKKIWEELGHQPLLTEYIKLGKYSKRLAWKFWKNWNEFIESIGGKQTIIGGGTLLEQWIKRNNISEFDLEDYFKSHPKQRKHISCVNSSLSKLINEEKLYHGNDKDSFIVDWHEMGKLHLIDKDV